MRKSSYRAIACLLGVALAWPVSAAVASYGSIEITTEPDTTILWEGVDLGVTDSSGHMSISTIPLGSYTVTLQKEGFQTQVKEIVVSSGDQMRPVSVPLSPLKRPVSVPAVQVSALAVPVSVPADVPADALPDPFARTTSYFGIVLPAAILLLVAGGVFFLLRRRQAPLEEEFPEPIEGPHLAFEQDQPGRRRPPKFYEALRQRETTLEGFEDRGPNRPAPKIIDLPVPDRQPLEGDS